MRQIIVQFDEIEPFQTNNADLGPSSRPRLLAILTNPEKLKNVKLELVSVIDWGRFLSRLPTILRKMAYWHLHVTRKCKRLMQQLGLHTHTNY